MIARSLRWALECYLAAASLASSEPLSSPAYKDQQWTEFFRRTSGWVAGDGAFSIPLSDGRVLWLFGDSHIEDYDAKTGTMPCLFQVRNVAMIQASNELNSARTLLAPRRGDRSLFKRSPNHDEWFWPTCGFEYGTNVYVYLTALRKTGEGGQWGFEGSGSDYWARMNSGNLQIDYIKLPPSKGISFGQGFVTQGANRYAFGIKRSGTNAGVFVGRMSATNPEGAWSFWDGMDWNANPERAAAIFRAPSTSVHVCWVNSRYLLTSSAFSVACDQGREIFMATSRSPTGPFSELKMVFRADDEYHGHQPMFYLPVAHPEFTNGRGEILVTYNINNYEPCISACSKGRATPDHYRPRAIRVPLALLKD